MPRSLTEPAPLPPRPSAWWQRLNPWRHFAAALGGAVVLLVVVGAVLAAQWAAREAEQQLYAAAQQRLQLLANQGADALLTRLQLRLAVLRTAAAQWALQDVTAQALTQNLQALQTQQPELRWLGLRSASGAWLAMTAPWSQAQQGALSHVLPTTGGEGGAQPLVLLQRSQGQGPLDTLILAVPLPGGDGVGGTGLLLAKLPWLWLQAEVDAQLRALDAQGRIEFLLLSADGHLLAGPATALATHAGAQVDVTQGGRYLARQAVAAGADAGWQLWVREPSAQALALAHHTHRAVLLGVLGGGLLLALVVLLVAHRLLRRLNALAAQARAVHAGTRQQIDVPPGQDEVHTIGVTLAQLIGHWQAERAALHALNQELDARVAARTARVQQLAQEMRQAAVVRERLRLARGLHDTLAHSLMALLTQIRLLRKLGPGWDRARWDEELQQCEQLTASGLAEARAAIGQLRSNGVADNGLGPELQQLLASTARRCGWQLQVDIAPAALDLVDAHAATVHDMVRELLRNTERHAQAQHVCLSLQPHNGEDGHGDREAPLWCLQLQDDGRGFDPAAPCPGHFGLLGLQEQAQQMGAQYQLHSAPGQGCRVRLVFASG